MEIKDKALLKGSDIEALMAKVDFKDIIAENKAKEDACECGQCPGCCGYDEDGDVTTIHTRVDATGKSEDWKEGYVRGHLDGFKAGFKAATGEEPEIDETVVENTEINGGIEGLDELVDGEHAAMMSEIIKKMIGVDLGLYDEDDDTNEEDDLEEDDLEEEEEVVEGIRSKNMAEYLEGLRVKRAVKELKMLAKEKQR